MSQEDVEEIDRDKEFEEELEKEREMSELEKELELKQDKAKLKTVFTKTKNKLYRMLEERDRPIKKEIMDICEEINYAQNNAIDVILQLSQYYSWKKDIAGVKKLNQEVDMIESENTKVQEKAQEYLDSLIQKEATSFQTYRKVEVRSQEQNHQIETSEIVDGVGSHREDHHKREVGFDMWKQLKRVSIPMFDGTKREYEGWKAAFTACIDQVPVTAEYKLLQLRQYLTGEALKVVQNLGHSATAYEVAKERLDRKFGGKRRQVALQLEELENVRPIRPAHSKDVEKFADILDVAVANLREAGRTEELGNGSLYSKVQKKMTEDMISRYQRWIFEKRIEESVLSLREWVLQEAEFLTIASETVNGMGDRGRQKPPNKDRPRTFYVNQQKERPLNHMRDRLCKMCNGPHGVWNCEKFKSMDTQNRWRLAKEFSLCYRCLGINHRGQTCWYSRVCGINGCKETHHKLLHAEKITTNGQQHSKGRQSTSSDQKKSVSHADMESEAESERSHTTFQGASMMSLRTIPVILKNGNRTITVNALLDDASTKSYINADVAAELNLQGKLQQVRVNVLNDQIETFETMPVEVGLESMDGTVDIKVSAYTNNKVTGELQVVNWQKHSGKWSHLQDVNFPQIGPTKTNY